MALLNIINVPNPVLKKTAEPVDKVDDEIRQLMDDMLETMYANDGIGLAANQVGVLKRVLVMDIVGKNSDGSPPAPYYMANPEIIWQSEELHDYQEGCLSVPDQYATVTRPKKAKIQYLDRDNNTQILEADELLATCVQHEIDHLNGIVFIDYLSSLKRNMMVRKVKKITKTSQQNIL
jgi:peptide deformylase